MIADTDVQLIVKFFTFMFLDERMAFESAGRIVAWQKAQMIPSSGGSRKTNVDGVATAPTSIRGLLVRACAAEYARNQKANAKYIKSLDPTQIFARHPQSAWEKWQSFMLRNSSEVAMVTLLKMILGFSTIEICEGLGITDGTMRMRLNRGLQFLGSESAHA